MNDIYVYDKNLNLLGIFDTYKSLIWAERYRAVGDCEVYFPAAAQEFFQIGNYIGVDDSDMLCRIDKIEIDTSAENGDYIIVTGTDTKTYLDQRVVMSMASWNGLAELFVRQLVSDALITGEEERKLYSPNGNLILALGDLQNFNDTISEQVSYKNIGEKIREYCVRFGWGYKFSFDGEKLKFTLYKGENRSNYVVFSSDYENISESQYILDRTHLGNFSLIGGEGEGESRKMEIAGDTTGTDRFELFVDAKDISSKTNYKSLRQTYPNGNVFPYYGGSYAYIMPVIDFPLIDENYAAELEEFYDGGELVTVDGVQYWRVENCPIAILSTGSPDDNTECVIFTTVYNGYLVSRGYDKMSEYGETEVYNGQIEPNTTFELGKDYFLGDIVTVEGTKNISVRIVEIVKVNDENGYRVEPKFENLTEG